MYETISCECRQAFKGMAFWAAIIGTVIVMVIGSFTNVYEALHNGSTALLDNGYHDTLFLNTLASETMCMALPVLCALPYTASYLDDVNSGFIKLYLPRTKISHYIIGKLTACMLSGGMALVLGLLLYYICALLIFLPMEAAAPDGAAGVSWFSRLWAACVLFFCAGAFWSLTGMAFAAVTGSKYMAYASPFILYYVLIILKERYFKELYVIDPREWIAPDSEKWVFGTWGVIILLSLAALIGALSFGTAAARRLERI